MLANPWMTNRFCKKLFLSDDGQQLLKTLFASPISFSFVKMSTGESSTTTAATADGASNTTNKLKGEKSPYLLQHQTNPVHWYPWGEEAFALARTKKLPIFLSVGYSTCHWCHVMERESFEKVEIAKIMNKYFINIKMDREEHPDIDRIYMTFVQAVSGSGGWPMSVWMTPDLKPFYGGTYYPPEDRAFGRPGFKSLLLTIADQWKENSEKFTGSAEKILEVLERTASLPMPLPTDKPLNTTEVSTKCLQQLSRSFEPAFGGFSDHPKFPQPVNVNFLIYFRKANPDNNDALKMIDKTLRGIAKGGIHDHVGKGFCRYSTDKKWHVPHFEKMLYDNAQLAVVYTNAFLLTQDAFFARIVRDILEYVNRDMSHDEGGFYSAEDADSYPTFESKVKVEGAFYAWTKTEIETVLGERKLNVTTKLTDLFHWRYGVRDNGNVDPRQDPHDELKRKNVLYIGHSVEDSAKHFGLSSEEVRRASSEAKSLLFEFRNQTRPRPGLDTKFLASWNGLMISAFARAGAGLNRKEYIDRAVRAMDFVNTYLVTDTGDILRSCYRSGDTNSSKVTNLDTPILGCVDDFGNIISANIDLFEVTGNLDYLRMAIQLQKKQDEIFGDSEKGGYFNSREGLHTIVRFKDDDDGAEPSANSVAAVNLIRLFSLTQNPDYENKVKNLFEQFADRLVKIPMSLPLMTSALSSYKAGAKLVVVLRKTEAEAEVVEEMRGRLLPLGSSVLSLHVSESGNLAEWKSLVPGIAANVEEFLAGDAEEMIFWKQGTDNFTRVSNKSEIFDLVKSL